MALTADRKTPYVDDTIYAYGIASATTIYAGSLVALNSSGYAVPASTALNLVAVGRSDDYVVNAGGAGAKNITVRRGVFKFKNSSSSDEITIAEIGDAVYIADDETVAKTSNGSTRSIAGVVTQVDSDGVWVRVGAVDMAARQYTLLLSGIDLDDEAAIRTFNIPVPIAGRITSIRSVTYGATTAGADAVLTFSVNNDAITGGVVTIASSSATGSVDSATPTAANDVEVTDYIKMVITGAQSADSYANVSIVVAH